MLLPHAGITLANYIGLSRLLLWTPLAIGFVLVQRWDAAFASILMAGISDMADGFVARLQREVGITAVSP